MQRKMLKNKVQFNEEEQYSSVTRRDFSDYDYRLHADEFIRIHEDDLSTLIDTLNALKFVCENQYMWNIKFHWKYGATKNTPYYDKERSDEVQMDNFDVFYIDIRARVLASQTERLIKMRGLSAAALKSKVDTSVQKLYKRLLHKMDEKVDQKKLAKDMKKTPDELKALNIIE